MGRDEVLTRLRERRADLDRLGVAKLYLYGSVARETDRADSDVDLVIDPKDEEFSLFDMMRVQDVCTELLGRPAEVHDYHGLARAKAFQARVRADLVNVF